jgi:Fur family ferric uptake transcriptional regulator
MSEIGAAAGELERGGRATPRFDSFKEGRDDGSVPEASDLERLLRAAGLRVTGPRLAVLAAVRGHPHADTDSLIDIVRREFGEVSHQAVYDGLRTLTDVGLLRRIQPMGSVARYETRVGDNHHHLVCRSCGEIVDVDCAVGDAACLTASEDAGYEIDEAEVIYWGRCPTCSRRETVPRSPDRFAAQRGAP